MRNGNLDTIRGTKRWEVVNPVLILPMRNGNENHILEMRRKNIFVLILPMRNGNLSLLYMDTWIFPDVLILPMRNGNLLIIPFLKKGGKSSYPTYEEWKQESLKDKSPKIRFLSYL